MLLIDRGSREKEAKQELEVICKKIKEKGDYEFSNYCFLEVIPPYIEEGINQSLTHNIDELTIVPYFLYPGKKIKAAVNESIGFQEKTDVKLRITKPMSMHKTMIDLVDNRITSALSENSVNLPKNAVDVLVIGHGSKDPNAKRSMEYVIDGIKPTYRNVSFCFLEIEEPNIKQGIIKCKND
ncbi:MAG: CbiX/SirB N-terminal domain-containing protein, partial [Thermoproteota archaeon]|nr:CbiX/SirB N-terminal domain-containing protein [Thermoproteota archaeon]